MLNSIVIMGRLVATPEFKKTPSDISVTTFTVAVERDYVAKGQDKQTDFIDVVAWRHTAEFVTKYFSKGSMIAVEGQLQTRSYEDSNGNKRKAVEVVANKVSFCGSKSESGGQNTRGADDYQPEQNTNSYNYDDDLPF